MLLAVTHSNSVIVSCRWNGYFVSLYMIVFITENSMVNSGELIGTAEYLLLSMRCCTNSCHNKRVRLCVIAADYHENVKYFECLLLWTFL
jgi:hypothetical protein